jgi:hypothetical protein
MNKFRYTVTARPTFYNGTQYRSELEAAWAAFFELRGINSEYEPALDLISWRPDFLIRVGDDFQLAEVKPFLNVEQWKNSGVLQKVAESLQGSTLAVLLGVSPISPSNFLFRIVPLPVENPEFEPLSFGETEDVERDWKRAKNAVQWRPSGN